MASATIYFKDSDRELVINDVINILTPTDDPRIPFNPIAIRYLFFDDDREYIFECQKQHVFIRGSAILCASVTDD